MRDRTLEERFSSFRDDQDVAALGDVFDAVAAELRRVALGLTRDSSEADDLVQTTFLTAIERAQRWNSEESLLPWLLGILVNHAREARRRRARTPEIDRLPEREVEDPQLELERAEVRAALSQALEQLSPDDRAVIEPVFDDSRRPAELARERGVALGTMRMRLSRALGRLRERLPASVALPAFFGVSRPPGFDAVRSRVLAHAGASQTVATGTVVLGGIAMSKKLVLLALSAVALVGLSLFARSFGNVRVEADEAGPRSAELVAPSRRGVDVAPAEVEAPRVASTARVPEGRSEAASSASFTTGLFGRLVEHDGSLVPNCSITLFGLEDVGLGAERFELPEQRAKSARVVLARGRTDGKGRFQLDGARSGAQHVLGIDVGGPRATTITIHGSMDPGGRRDLGDVVLAEVFTLTGRVVDEAGEPIVGARVRAADLPEQASMLPVAEIDGDTKILMYDEGRFDGLLGLAPFAAEFVCGGSMATTETDAKGQFRLSLPTDAKFTIVADAPGYAPLLGGSQVSPFIVGTSLEDFVLLRGRSLAGRVVDSEGAPIANAELVAGPHGLGPGSHVSLVRDRGRSDSDGRFEILGLPSDGDLVIAACRASGGFAWTVKEVDDETGENVVLTLEDPLTLEVEVLDERGERALDARVRLRPSANALGVQAIGFASVDAIAPSEQIEGGLVRFAGSCPERCIVQVTSPDHGRAEVEVSPGELDGPLVVRLESIWSLEVVVRDEATGEPVPDAVVRTGPHDARVPGPTERTDSAGIVRLALDPEKRWRVRAEHPRFAPRTIEPMLGQTSIEMKLNEGGSLRVQVFDARGDALEGAELQLSTLEVYEKGQESLGVPQVQQTDAEGFAHFARLESGEIDVALLEERTIQSNAAGWLMASVFGSVAHTEEVVIVEGTTTELVFGDEGTGTLSGVAGRVNVTGDLPRPLQAFVVGVGGSLQDSSTVSIERDGSFSILGLEPGQCYFGVQFEPAAGASHAGFEFRELSLTANVTEWVEIDLLFDSQVFEVVDESGKPVAGASVQRRFTTEEFESGMSGQSAAGFSDEAGRVELALVGDGPFRIRGDSPEVGYGELTLESSVDGVQRLVLVSHASIDVEFVVADSTAIGSLESAMVSISPSNNGAWRHLNQLLHFENGRARFSIRGIEAGTWIAHLNPTNGILFKPVILEVPEHGLRDEEFVFQHSGSSGSSSPAR